MTALLAALNMVLVMMFFPAGPGIVHLGDVIVLLAGCLLPAPYAMAAAVVGGGLGDWITGCSIWLPATVIIKPAVAALFSAKQEKLLTRRNLLMLMPYAAITLLGYALYKLLLVSLGLMDGGAWLAVLAANVAGDSVQVIGSAAVFAAIGFAMDRAGLKKRI